MQVMTWNQEKLWNFFYNKGIVTDDDKQSFIRNYPTDAIAKQTYDQWNKGKPSRSQYIDNENQMNGSVETRHKKSKKSKVKRCRCKK